jgi:hypothetical protein
MEKYKLELKGLLNEYQDFHDKINLLESQIQEQMSIYNQLKNKLDDIRRREKEIINNIEHETGKKVTSSKIASLL